VNSSSKGAGDGRSIEEQSAKKWAEDLQSMRANLHEWVQQQTSSWNSVAFVSLNLKNAVRTDAGTYTSLNEQIARREIELFGKRVDRAIYGRLVQRFNRRVRRIPFIEYGHDRGWHAHVLMETPDGMVDVRFHQIVKNAWSQSPWSTTLHNRVADEEGPGYLTKYRSKSELEAWMDTIVLEAVVIDTK
jgi:hypothetical protein